MDLSLAKIFKHQGPLLVLCFMLLPGVAVAQQYYDPGLLHKTIQRKPADFESVGVRLGSFTLKTGAELSVEHDDNIFSSQTSETVSDNLAHVRPWAILRTDWSRHSLSIGASADIARFDEHGDEDYEDLRFNLDGRVEVRRQSGFNYEAAFFRLHEDRSSPDDAGGVAPTVIKVIGLALGYTHTFNRVTAALDFETETTDYNNNLNADGKILDNQDRDRSRDALGLKLSYEVTAKSSIFVGATINQVDFDQQTDNSGFQRSSKGRDYSAGVSWEMTGLLVGDLFLQYFNQDHDDPAFNNINRLSVGASLNWNPTQTTNVVFDFRSSPQETTQAGAAGFASSLYALRVQQELRHNLLANARFSYTDNDYVLIDDFSGSLRATQVYRAGIGLNYLINRHATISGGYEYEKQDANIPAFEYKGNRWFITLGVDL